MGADYMQKLLKQSEVVKEEISYLNTKMENCEKNQAQILKFLAQTAKNLETCHKSVDEIYLEKDENRGLLCQLREEILERADRSELGLHELQKEVFGLKEKLRELVIEASERNSTPSSKLDTPPSYEKHDNHNDQQETRQTLKP